MPWLYHLARRVFRRGVRFYFMQVQRSGEDNIPADGATIFASNHPNSVMDTVVLGSEVPRAIHYLARSGLFSNPAVGAFLRGAGAIPIKRRQDLPTGEKAMSNDNAFDAAHAVLREGGVIGIFPEGRNAPSRHVRDIKTGAARIALGAEASADFSLDLRIVPVGLNYENRDQFLSNVLIRFGPPIELRDYKEQYEADPRAATLAITARLQEAMRDAATHMAEDIAPLVDSIDALVGEELTEEMAPTVDLRTIDQRLFRGALGRAGRTPNLDGRFRVRQAIADAVAHFEEADPESLARLEKNIDGYRLRLRQLRLQSDMVEHSFVARTRAGRKGSNVDLQDAHQRSLSSRRQSVRIMLYAILLAPIALYGLVHNFFPFRFARRYALGAKEEAIIAIRSFGGGLFFFGLAYAGFASLAHHAGESWLKTLMYLSTLPISGVWFLRYRHNLQRMREQLLFRTLFQTRHVRIRGLIAQRAALRTQITRLREQYQATLSDGESTQDSNPAVTKP